MPRGEAPYRPTRLRQKRRKPLTCVIGAKGADGCAIIADTRVMWEAEAYDQSKLNILWDRIVLAGSGSAPMLEMFADGLAESKIPEAPNLSAASKQIEDVIYAIRERYEPRIGEDCELEALIMGLDGFSEGEPYLRHVYSRGFSERIDNFAIIGHGAPYASMLFRLLYDPLLTAKELAILGWFTISAIVSSGLDQTVGIGPLGPEAVMVRTDEAPQFLTPFDEQLSAAKDSLSKRRYRLKLLENIWGRVPQAYARELADDPPIY